MPRRSWTICSLLAATVYLALALWHFRAVLPAPATLLPENPYLDESFTRVGRLDTNMVLWVSTGNAHRLLHRPWAPRSEGQCHPLPDAFTLGEHMLGEGVLAALPLAVTGDPIVAYNVALIAALWIAALGMFALTLHFTRSPAAAFVAGLLFCLEPARLTDTGHPFIHGDLWAPLVLLFLHRTLARGGVANALACALFLCLTLLESLYAVIATLLVVAPYGLYALSRHGRRAGVWIGPLLLAAAIVAGCAVLVFDPYLVARRTWDVLVRPGALFMPLDSYLPGRSGFPGWTLLLLGALGLVERLWRRRDEEGEDPRLALACAALLVLWCSVRTVPLAGVEIPSPLLVAKRFVPGLDSVRALWSVGRGAVLALAPLAGYGVLALARGGARRAVLVACLLGCAVLAERYLPAAARATFGQPLDLAARVARPPEDDVALLRAHAQGALLDIPWRGVQQSIGNGEDLPLESFSPRPTGACYNSFPSPLQPQLDALVKDLPAPAAVDALVALGFETLLLHLDRVQPDSLEIFMGQVEGDPRIAARVALLGRSDRLWLFRLSSPLEVASIPAQLAASGPDGATAVVAPGPAAVEVLFHNRSERVFVHPAPIARTAVDARWYRGDGVLAHAERARMLLPIALAPGAAGRSTVDLVAPREPGTYVLTIHAADQAGEPLAWTRVVVRAAAEQPLAGAAASDVRLRETPRGLRVDTQEAP
jgi:hypothetical protein